MLQLIQYFSRVYLLVFFLLGRSIKCAHAPLRFSTTVHEAMPALPGAEQPTRQAHGPTATVADPGRAKDRSGRVHVGN